ncbi:4-amino-4-deoxychorismate lyase [Bacillus sp. FJAT-42376]|uniref:aminodeoxychorismate lyase n=1 Tax=Bacillus sp. FJAT-42376 TaxID=2014076 RepID=UPI000F4E70F0|nr:aminodeoxychorismate lyase [Bacillus sp. FJAT-42376]AZB41213.1 4-amino-4-deoxychorismate lyase [Bacillus sp. FJAT-42376]
MFVFLNSKLIKGEEASVSLFDHGYMYGLGVFETFRTYQGHSFLLADHLARLNASLSELGIKVSLNAEQVHGMVQELLAANQMKNGDAAVRLTVSAGNGGPGFSDQVYEEPVISCFLRPIASPADQKQGQVLQLRRNTPEGAFRMKSSHYMNNFLAKKELYGKPDTEGIFLTKEDHICEGIVSNVFWVKNGTVFTPAPETGALDGITRKFVLALCRKLNVPYKEGFFPLHELLSAEEAFMTNSVQEVIPFSKIDIQSFAGKDGAVTQKLKEEYAKYRHALWSRDEL